MKTVLWLIVAYQLGVGLAELTWVAWDSPALARVATLPAASSVIDPVVGSSGSANYIEGALDVAVAGAVWWVGLR